MKVLVIGDIISTGMKLIKRLVVGGCQVVVAGNIESVTQLEQENIVCYDGDIYNRFLVGRLFVLHKFDCVIFILDKEKPFCQQETLDYFKESVSVVTDIMEKMVLYKIPSFILLSLNEKKSSGYEKMVSAISSLLDWTEERYGVHSMVFGEENLNVDEIILEHVLSTLT